MQISGHRSGQAGHHGETPYPELLIPRLNDDQIAEIAERHLAELASAERTPPSRARPVWLPRVRRSFRLAWTAGVWLLEMVIRPWEYIWNPRRPLGRLWQHVRLLTLFKTLNGWKVLLGLFALAMGLSTYLEGPKPKVWFISPNFWTETWWVDVNKALFIGAVVGLLAALWSDLFRNPWLGLRIRRHIRKNPSCILHDNLDSRPVMVMPRNDAIEIAPRDDLYDEVLPGALTRARKDVQILVGEPGAGKTTALVVLAGVLVKIGIVPVLVPLRSQEGMKDKIKLSETAREQFVDQVDRFVRSREEAEGLWRWLYKRRRVAILTDDIDQMGADGERGMLLRRTIEDAMTLDLPVIVTARPAGLPAGIAVSAIDVEPLAEDAALEAVVKGASNDAAFKPEDEVAPRQLEDWIREGDLTEVPFYLELLASLAAVNRCPKLPQMDELATARERIGRYRRMPDGHYEWNPLWVRFMLLERFYAEAAGGKVRRWLGIETGERRSTLVALEGAALGTLVAAGLKAKAGQQLRGQPDEQNVHKPRREDIADFLGFDDRDPYAGEGQRARGGRPPKAARRAIVSAHEAADTGERLRILDRDTSGKLQFRHRIMQAYLAGSRLAVIEFERLQSKEALAKEPGDDEQGDDEQGADEQGADGGRADGATQGPRPHKQWIKDLLDPHHPEKLTANMALTFAVMCAQVEKEAAEAEREAADNSGATVEARNADGPEVDNPGIADKPGAAGPGEPTAAERWGKVAEYIVEQLHQSALRSLHISEDRDSGTTAVLALEERREGGETLLEAALVTQADGGEQTAAPLYDLLSEINPKYAPDPDERVDPDDALMKLTTAAEAAHAIGYRLGGRDRTQPVLVKKIVEGVREARFGTRWTKTKAIEAVARLGSTAPAAERAIPASLPAWKCIWEFARDDDFKVRQAAGDALCDDAYNAYRALREKIDMLIFRAAARSALGLPLHTSEDETHDGNGHIGGWALAMRVSSQAGSSTAMIAGAPASDGRDASEYEDELNFAGISAWKKDESQSLEALGVVLPAIVSGLREDPEVHALDAWQGRSEPNRLTGERPSRDVRHRKAMSDVDYVNYRELVGHAYTTLARLAALSFQGNQHRLEDALARGFKADAMRHAHDREPLSGSTSYAGPGWIASNRRIVLDICVRQAGSWYARLLLAQALALYTIAGAKKQEAYNALAEQVHRGRELHPFTQRGARFARAAIRRSRYPVLRWHRWIWDDEAEVAGRRQARLNRPAAQLAADVTLLLDLNEGSPEDCQEPFGAMRELPHCLSSSRDRQEILGKGCPQSCGWNFCPYKQPPPDEPNSQRGVSRAFCRQQQRYATWHQPKWQTHIPRRKLKAFWEEMERRART